MSAGRPGRGASLGAMLFAALLVLSVAAFAVERAARSDDDLVNTVELSPRLTPPGSATVAFTLAEPDGDVEVRIIDGNPGSTDELVRTLEAGAPLAAGPQRYQWDGRDDAGDPAPPGLYALQVILGEADRDIRPPGRVEIVGEGG